MPIIIGNILARRRELLDQGMMRREMAHRVGGAGVAGDQEGLTAAAAEILLAAAAAFARFLHPVGAAERGKGRRGPPNIAERVLAHVPEFQTWNNLGGMAGQHFAGRRDIERAAAPAANPRTR